MDRALRFRINSSLVELNEREEMVALDWIRREQRLTGTKEGCREGDCGACMVLLGENTPDGVRWKAALSCLLALGELDGRHVITIEGLGANGVTPVMEAMLDEGASQCGFCSPGFIVSLTGYLINGDPGGSGGALTPEGAVRSVEGNLCRCTGYGSIQRAADRLIARFGTLPDSLPQRLALLSRAGVIPEDIAALMIDLPAPAGKPSAGVPDPDGDGLAIGGGTDYYVRNPDPQPRGAVAFTDRNPAARLISRNRDIITLGASVSIQQFFESELIRTTFPGIERYEGAFASLPIRTRATLAGNITNASPIGDMTAILLSLGTVVRICSSAAESVRSVPLENYFLSYRRTALEAGEYVETLQIPIPANPGRLCFNFEKVAKRTHLDIASANSASFCVVSPDGTVSSITLSAGGVGPVPLRLVKVEEFLRGRQIDSDAVRQAAAIAAEECSPIDDVRGTAAYRRTLLGRFIWAHLMSFFPELTLAEELLP